MSVNEITREELFKAWDDFDKEIARESKGVDISQITVDELYSSHMKKSPDVLKLELSLCKCTAYCYRSSTDHRLPAPLIIIRAEEKDADR
ncbi:MAG: hypothetical protein K6G27_14890 [Lachnospiraceae bacterium]|nr:hypothetical protein [Lachnospiraceae bacterium]